MLDNILLKNFLLKLQDFIKRNLVILTLFVCTIIVFLFFYSIFLSSPKNFPINAIYDLKSGSVLSVVSNDLYNKKIIKSVFWFKSFVYVFSFGDAKILEGDYGFYEKQNLIKVAWRITHGELDIVPIKITIPEGLNSKEIADIYVTELPSFNKNVFVNLVNSLKLEGYLFPDTYLFMPNIKESEIIKTMNDNFNNKIKKLELEIKKTNRGLSDIIKMASILEEEARLSESRRIVAGILWNRLSIGMPLQVDSSFKYINGKTTANLSLDDLKIDSPYNSYLYKGLPPTPISNPGMGSIQDAINPVKTKYLYFLTDKDGDMHYSVSYNDHLLNKEKYLK